MSQPQTKSVGQQRPSRVAKLAWYFALITLALIAIGVLGATAGLLPPLTGFMLFGLGMVLGSVLTLLVGLIGIVVTRPRGGGEPRPGRGLALRATAIGAVLLIVFGVLVSRSGNVPAIHDVTTDPDDPPQFVAAAKVAQSEGRALTYPQGDPETRAKQREGYPDLEPIGVDLPPDQALERSSQVAEDLGWEVVDTDAAAGRLEATATSRLFHFVDDVVVRIRPAESGSIVDLRSTSRVGQSDIGANAKRIREFREHLTENE